MNSVDLILKYFPDLTPTQINQFEQLKSLYEEWNAQINVISRKDVDNFYERHVLHSLGIAKIMSFHPGSTVLDVGTGGGFPGIPLAILFPETKFHLVDSIGKKIKVVKGVSESIGLKNLTASHQRAEKVTQKFDFIVSRAVTAMPAFINWVKTSVKSECINSLPNGILYLKGGDLTEEMQSITYPYDIYALSKLFEEEFFETKKVVHLSL